MTTQVQRRSSLNQWCSNTYARFCQHIENFSPPYKTFALFGIINYPLFYIFAYHINRQDYTNLTMRLIAGVLCLALLLKDAWPDKLKLALPAYWYLTLIYCLPFFHTYLLFKNHGSPMWQLHIMLVLYMLILVVDWLSFAIILLIGTLIAWAIYSITDGTIIVIGKNIPAAICTYIFAIVIGALFSRSRLHIRENSKLKKHLQGMTTVASSIAHELRTPLASIRSGIKGSKLYLPTLIAAYEKARQAHLDIPTIRPHHYEALLTLLDDIEAETHFSNTMINMLLIKVNRTAISESEMQSCSIATCIDEAIRRYPFHPSEQAQLIHWDPKQDFIFKGNELLTIHVLFNLMKNALYYIAEAGKGEVTIFITKTRKFNQLHFKDTGAGIANDALPKLFERFYTTTPNGTGVGLAFCRMIMEGIGGSIHCDSVESEFTEFVLIFPKV